jgi:hypothetical protein
MTTIFEHQIVQYNWINEKQKERILVNKCGPHALEKHPFTKIAD